MRQATAKPLFSRIRRRFVSYALTRRRGGAEKFMQKCREPAGSLNKRLWVVSFVNFVVQSTIPVTVF
jgi:hypothetical protein